MPIGNIGALYDTDNVLVGSAVGFVAPVGTAAPDDSVTVFDPAIWVDPWVSCGATEQGWQVNWAPQTTDIRIDEQATPVDQTIDSASLQFVANLSEDTIASWALALNADKTVVAPTTTAFGKTTLVPSQVPKYMSVVLETQNELQMPRRFYIPKVSVMGNVGAQFRRSGTQRLIPVTFTSVCNFSDIEIIDITATPTA